MKNKVFKLIKRLNSRTIDKILPTLRATRGEICPIFDEFVMEGHLKLRVDCIYFYKEPEQEK